MGDDIWSENAMARPGVAAAALLALGLAFGGCVQRTDAPMAIAATVGKAEKKMDVKPTVVKTDDEWKRTLSPEQYRVLRQAGTERAFTGEFWNHHENGAYTCAGCGAELFRSNEKFDSGCGWPSFYEALDKSRIVERQDRTLGMVRTEVLCKQCGGHLGHVFPDGPRPTGLRYCINSASLNFQPAEPAKTK